MYSNTAEVVALAKAAAAHGGVYTSHMRDEGIHEIEAITEAVNVGREAGMPVCGPNCMGILNPPARVTTYKQNVMETAGLAGNVGVVSQSGSVCIALLSDLRRFGISLSVSAGNEAVTRTVDYLEYLIDDHATKVIATFIETVREPERYVAALDRAAKVGKPVVVLKVGRSERTQKAITSHTGGLAGESRVFSEVLRAHRAIEVGDLDEMTEVLAVCQGTRWPRGRRISVVSGSGGLAELILDHKVDVCDVSVASVTDRFLARAKDAKEWNLEEATWFLAICAVLLEMKVSRLMPKPEELRDEDLLGGSPDLAYARSIELAAFRRVSVELARRLVDRAGREPALAGAGGEGRRVDHEPLAVGRDVAADRLAVGWLLVIG